MGLYEQVDLVSTREDFARFLTDALADLRNRPQDWENDTLESFLEAWSAWVMAMPSLCKNLGKRVPDQPDWNLLANMVMAARIYE